MWTDSRHVDSHEILFSILNCVVSRRNDIILMAELSFFKARSYMSQLEFWLYSSRASPNSAIRRKLTRVELLASQMFIMNMKCFINSPVDIKSASRLPISRYSSQKFGLQVSRSFPCLACPRSLWRCSDACLMVSLLTFWAVSIINIRRMIWVAYSFVRIHVSAGDGIFLLSLIF